MKKKILIISNFTGLPSENSNSRFIYIMNLIDKEKFDVELIAPSFCHEKKVQRENNLENNTKDYKITLINEPGYKKHVSLKRFYSHYKFAKNVKKYLETVDKPYIIYCAVPSLDVAKVAGEYAKKNNIRFILDIQDLWPEAFKMVFNIPIISNLIFKPMEIMANNIYKKADDLIAVSETYLTRGTKINKNCKNKLSVFLGTELEKFDNAKKQFEIVPFDDVIRIAYIGTLGHSYDIKCVIDAIKILNEKGIKNVLFAIMGSGPLQEEFESYAKMQGVNSDFTGRLCYEEMVGKLCSCDIAVNPIKAGSAGSIINKVGDYAAARTSCCKYSRK